MKLSDKEIVERLYFEEFGQDLLLEALKDYAKPWDKVARLEKAGIIQRVWPGWYVKGQAYRSRPISRFYLANLLCSPSCVSMESALAHYGLIPEQVHSVTSVSPNPDRTFDTPLGRFSYKHVPRETYSIGLDLSIPEASPSFFIATPEKALADRVQAERGSPLRNRRDLETFLFDGLRMEEASLSGMSPIVLRTLAGAYHSRKLTELAALIESMASAGKESERDA
jgi:hypothetical protein